jgi:hypothetical protein
MDFKEFLLKERWAEFVANGANNLTLAYNDPLMSENALRSWMDVNLEDSRKLVDAYRLWQLAEDQIDEQEYHQRTTDAPRLPLDEIKKRTRRDDLVGESEATTSQ